MLFYDNTMVVLLPAIIISGLAQLKIKSSFSKYSKVNSANGYTGEKVARMLLDDAGLFDIPVEIVGGKLTDHYDPSKRVMRLSKEVYNGTTVAAIGVAAHETGHALQDKEKYAPLKIRNAIVPAVNFSSNASWLLFLIGIILSVPSLVNIGIILFSAVVVFQLITLPVEFNASSRALTILESKSILYGDEIKGAKAVLSAAAMTYVAATLMAVSQLIRLVLLSRDR
ncbi:zinc metallopeptidase [Clostridium estertheticum]|uniref:zinc metallopeptidase n=1 Tax=Clostridium estertheticum TaxID=238834 RepID=UPI0013EE58FF|nr:zinc metallopeptidase [Clostridium estertheticum]MBZ9608349.1 zinc metallopeptidase [Clostridium estertheticum]